MAKSGANASEDSWVLRRTDKRQSLAIPLKGASLAYAYGEGEKRKLTLGREPPCTVVIRDDTVSAKHCELALATNSVVLRDLASTNGCVVNGRDLPRNGAVKLRVGDSIELGDAQFVLERVEVEEPAEEEEEEEAEEEKPLIATGGLAVGDIRVGKRIGGGSFGTVFEGSWRGEAIILKCANTRVEGAAVLLEQEMQLNEIAMQRAPDTCAAYIGALEVSAAASGPIYQGILTQGLWLAWRLESTQTLWFFLQRRGSTPALAAALGLDASERVGPQLELAVTRQVMSETLAALDAMHAAGLVHCDVKPQNMLITDDGIRLIDLGGGASCIYPPLLNYAPGEGVHDPLYSPPEANLLPDNAKPPTLRNARGLWKEHQPQLFDLYSAGVVMMQLALPRLRNDAALKTFREQLDGLDGDLAAWRAAKGTAADDAVLGQLGGWDLASGLLRVQRNAGKGKDASPGRLSCIEALSHPFLAEDDAPLLVLSPWCSVGKQRQEMKVALPTEDTLLSVSALAAGGLAAQFVLSPRATHDALFTQSIAWSNSMDVPWQAAGVALGGHALKDLTVAARSPKTTAESRGACQTAGWTWLCGSALSIGNALAKKGSAKEDASYASAAVMGALAATLLAKGYGLDEQEEF